MQRALLLLSTLCTASVAFRFAPPRTPLSTKPNIGLPSSSCQTHVVGLRKRVAAWGWQARAVGNGPRRTIFDSSGGDVQEDEADKNLEETVDGDGGWSLPGAGWMKGAVDRLKGYGPAGVIAYGLLNELYYTTAFAFLWLGPMGAAAIVAPASLGLRETVAISAKQFGKVAALVWLGSQATKPLRMALALALAPAAEGLLASTERRLRLPSRQAAFGLLLVTILGSTATFGAAAVAFAAARSAAVAATVTSSASPKASAAAVLLLGFRQGIFYGGGVVGGGDGGVRSLAAVGGGGRSIDETVQPRYARPGASGFFHRVAHGSATKRSVVGATQCTTVAATAAAAGVVMREDRGFDEKFDASSRESGPATRRPATPRRMSPQKAADRNPPPQDNIHGWKEHPNHLLGFWEVGRAEALPAPEGSRSPEAIAAAAPSVEAAAALAARPAVVSPESAAVGEACDGPTQDGGGVASTGSEGRGNREGGSVRSQGNALEGGGFSYGETAERDMVDLGSDVLHHVEYVVLKRDGTFKAGPAGIGVSPRSWRFAPANRRIVFEVDVPARGVTLRYSGKLKRKPGMFTRASGIIRVRPMSHAEGDRELPASSRLWPKLAGFAMHLDLPEKFRHRKRSDDGGEGRDGTSPQQ